jgi:DNA-binding response OmpR family regulator
MAVEGEYDPDMSSLLLIDADPLIRDELRAALRDTDLHLIEAGDGEVGLAEFRAHNPDLLLTEISLPGKGGLELIAEILDTRPQTKVFACSQPSADRGVDLLEIAKLLGATRTFRKPIDWPELVEAIRDELRPDRPFSH